jgi:RNA polymerase sigma-70 factor (ECF subfamily)
MGQVPIQAGAQALAADDAALAQAARAGRSEAFDALTQRYAARVLRFVRMRAATAADAEDLLQETFLRCWRKLAHYDASRPFATWLFKLAANVAASAGRRRHATPSDDVDALAGGVDPAVSACARDARGNLWDVVQRSLPAESGAALWLFYGENQSAAAIGEILGKSEGAVRVLLFRARARLAELLSPDAISSEVR